MLKNAKLAPGKNRGEFGVTVEEYTSYSGRRLIGTFGAAFSFLSMASVRFSRPSNPPVHDGLKYVQAVLHGISSNRRQHSRTCGRMVLL